MNIAQLSEQLKDVPQNRLVDYARNPNSVVPQFLALAEIQRRQQLSAQVAPPATTVAEEVLAQAQPAPQMMQPQAPAMAQQLPENQPGVATLPANVAPKGFAPGGLVAFANGGLSLDDDDEEDREYDALTSTNRLAGITDMLASIPAGVRALADKLPKSYEETLKAKTSGSTSDAESFLAKLEHLESRGRHFDSKGNILTSPKGAEGIMQVMRGTQRDPGFGVTPARDRSPEELQRVGREYGLAMLREFKDPQIAAMAYNWGPANVKKWLASEGKMPVPKETLAYRSHFADGGEVKRYNGEDDSEVSTDNEYLNRSRNLVEGIKSLGSKIGDAFTTPRNYDPITKFILDPAKSIQSWGQTPLEDQAAAFNAASNARRNVSMTNTSAPAAVNAPVVSAATPSPYGESENERLHARYPKPITRPSITTDEQKPEVKAAPEEGKGIDTIAPRPKSYVDLAREALEKDIEAQAAKAAKAGDMNLALSIMQAGLGMLGSKSPYGLTGIGEGAQQGVSTFAALKKQEADQAKDLMAARLGLYKFGSVQQRGEQEAEALREYRQSQLAQKGSAAAEDTQRHYMRLYDMQVNRINQQATNNVKIATKDQGLTPEEIATKVREEEMRLSKLPRNAAIFKNLEGKIGLPAIEEEPTYNPLPTSKDALVTGNIYNTSRGPARWDGKQFVPVR